MKAFTDIEQSKNLAKILPPDSADMCYRIVAYNPNDTHVYQPYCFVRTLESDIPCWSLAALLDIILEGIIENHYAPNLQKENGKYSIAYGNEELLCMADNPIDACVEMIIKLHELDVL